MRISCYELAEYNRCVSKIIEEANLGEEHFIFFISIE